MVSWPGSLAERRVCGRVDTANGVAQLWRYIGKVKGKMAPMKGRRYEAKARANSTVKSDGCYVTAELRKCKIRGQGLTGFGSACLLDLASRPQIERCPPMTKPSCFPAGNGVSHRLTWLLPIVCALLIGAFGLRASRAQGSGQDEVKSGPTASDRAAADEAKIVYRHARPANTPAGATLRQREIASGTGSPAGRSGAAGTTTADNDQLRFPADLAFNGGAVVPVAEQHPIFLLPNGNCPIAKCWGDPEGFLRDLRISEFIHITDQYVGSTANNRYPVGAHTLISYKPTPKTAPLTDADMVAVVHRVASASGQTGYSHMYHIFLPPGQDECFTAKDGICYSPDVPATFVFCAYHNSVDFSDIGHVLYTVEPYQNVGGCSVRPGTPNGQLIDSTNNSLSHETFETITDPDGTAWFNFTAVVLAGAEIGDECSFFVILPISPSGSSAFFDPSVATIGNHRYAVQPEYANNEHACASNP
jgi:hypothetical protein